VQFEQVSTSGLITGFLKTPDPPLVERAINSASYCQAAASVRCDFPERKGEAGKSN
jgi:hypothetical protein